MNNLIIMNNLVLYKTFLNERMRTIYIFVEFVYSNFAPLPFTWSALFCLKISLSISISEVFLICLNNSLLVEFFSINFSKEIAKLSSGLARSSANNSHLSFVHRLAIFVVSPFCLSLQPRPQSNF